MNYQTSRNYLRSYRKRAGLSQVDVAILFGAESGTMISRFERGVRHPTVAALVGAEILFEAPAPTIFPRLYAEASGELKQRALLLAQSTVVGEGALKPSRRREFLEFAARLDHERVAPHWYANNNVPAIFGDGHTRLVSGDELRSPGRPNGSVGLGDE